MSATVIIDTFVVSNWRPIRSARMPEATKSLISGLGNMACCFPARSGGEPGTIYPRGYLATMLCDESVKNRITRVASNAPAQLQMDVENKEAVRGNS